MAECSSLIEMMPLLLTESLDPAQRERTHQHIESCAGCAAEWNAYRETWRVMEDLPVVEVPARVRDRFLAAAGIAETAKSNVVPFQRRPAFKWLAQAAAVAVLVGGGWFAGRGTAPAFTPSEARIDSVSPIKPLSIAETRVVDANAMSPEIEGRPDIAN